MSQKRDFYFDMHGAVILTACECRFMLTLSAQEVYLGSERGNGSFMAVKWGHWHTAANLQRQMKKASGLRGHTDRPAGGITFTPSCQGMSSCPVQTERLQLSTLCSSFKHFVFWTVQRLQKLWSASFKVSTLAGSVFTAQCAKREAFFFRKPSIFGASKTLKLFFVFTDDAGSKCADL